MTRHSKQARSALATRKVVKNIATAHILQCGRSWRFNLLVMYPYLLKRKLFLTVRSIYPISWRHHNIASCTTCLYGKYFQRTLSFTLSRGVPLDCGCKGRYFLQTGKTFLQLFYGKFLTKSLNRWFSAIRLLKIFKDAFKKCHLYVAKHKKWRF